jgi:hypothetical protein
MYLFDTYFLKRTLFARTSLEREVHGRPAAFPLRVYASHRELCGATAFAMAASQQIGAH